MQDKSTLSILIQQSTIEYMSKQYLDADEVITLLGIRKSTLYSYVSRGLIRSERRSILEIRCWNRQLP